MYLNEYQNAIRAGKEAVTLAEHLFGRQDIRHAESLKNLAMAHFSNQEATEAISHLQEAVRIAGVTQDFAQSANIIHQYAGVLHTMGQHAAAEDQYQLGIQLREKHVGRSHPVLAKSYGDLSRLYFDMGKTLKEAEFWLRKAIQVLENFVNKETDKNGLYYEAMLDLAVLYHNLAYAHYMSKKYDSAKQLYTYCLVVLETFFEAGYTTDPAFIDSLVANLQDFAMYGPDDDWEYVSDLQTRLEEML